MTIKKRAPGYEGTAELHDPKGDAVWTNPISIPPKASCFILLDRLAYKTAFRIDPPSAPPTAPAPPLERAKPPAPVEPPKPPAPVEPPVPPEPVAQEPVVGPAAPPAAPVRARLEPRVGAGVRADFGAAGALFGVTVDGGFQRREWGWGGWSLMGAFRWAPQQVGIGPPTATASVDVRASLVAGRLASCIYRAWPVTLAGCVVGELGELQQSAATPTYASLHQTAMFAGGGVSARVEVPLLAHLHFRMEADVLGVAKLAGNTSAWVNVTARSLGGATGGLGAGLRVSF